MPGATLPPPEPELSTLGGSMEKTEESGLTILIRRFTLSLFRRLSNAVYFCSGSNASKTTSGGVGWKSGSSSGTTDSTLWVYSDMLSSSITCGRFSATGSCTVPLSSAHSWLGVRFSGSGRSAESFA